MKVTNHKLLPLCLVASIWFLFICPSQADTPLHIGFVQSWPASRLVTKVAAHIIEHRLDQPVELVPSHAASLYQDLASGKLDAQLSAWLPATHHEYYGKLWDQMINLGPNLMGATLGIAVPQYADIDSIAELRTHAGDFDYKIIGVDSGAGININTKKAIKSYNLPMHLLPSSTAAMGAALKKATEEHALIAVTGWKPLWIWHRFDLKLLKDPKHIYGNGEHVNTLVTPTLWLKAPDVFKFLERFRVTLDDINNMEDEHHNGVPEKQVVQHFLATHYAEINVWTYGLK